MCGNKVHDPGEVCDDGNNEDGDGCSADCSKIEEKFACPLVGKCYSCGNGKFEGKDPSIGLFDGSNEERCDDGNNRDGDGCSKSC